MSGQEGPVAARTAPARAPRARFRAAVSRFAPP